MNHRRHTIGSLNQINRFTQIMKPVIDYQRQRFEEGNLVGQYHRSQLDRDHYIANRRPISISEILKLVILFFILLVIFTQKYDCRTAQIEVQNTQKICLQKYKQLKCSSQKNKSIQCQNLEECFTDTNLYISEGQIKQIQNFISTLSDLLRKLMKWIAVGTIFLLIGKIITRF